MTAEWTTPAGGVSSVNGETGDVTLDAADVGAAPAAHTHAQSDVTGLASALSGKANTSHAHAISDTTGLQTALDGKAASAHTHDDRYYTESEIESILAARWESPGRRGLVGHSYPNDVVSMASFTLASQTLYLHQIVCESTVASGTRTVHFFQQNSGWTGVTLGRVAVFDNTGAQIGTPADVTATLASNGFAARQVSVGTFALTRGQLIWVGILQVGSSNGAFRGAAPAAGFINPTAVSGTVASQTSMPSSISLPANGGVSGMWVGVS